MDNYSFILREAEKVLTNYNDKNEKADKLIAKCKALVDQYDKKIAEEKVKLATLKSN